MAKVLTEIEYLKENPNATPYDMLMAGIITQERFDELDKDTKGAGTQSAKEFSDKAKAKVQPVTQTPKEFIAQKQNKLKPTKVIKHATQPQLSEYKSPGVGGNVWLNDNKTGKSTLMSRGAAEREQRKYPTRYTIS